MKKRILSVCIIGLWASCTKRLDTIVPGVPSSYNNIPSSVSAISILNMADGNDVAVNNKRLTTFLWSGGSGGTPWFSGGKMGYGAWYTIPDSLLTASGDAKVQLYTILKTKNFLFDSIVLNSTSQVHNNIDSQKIVVQYYPYLTTLAYAYMPDATVIPRTASGPSRPDNFKIRIVNLGASPFAATYDSLTLTYADGTPVSSKTSRIGYKQASDYIELPYGAIQFRITGADGQAIADFPAMSSEENGQAYKLNGLYFNKVRTFQPGGVYTLMVSWHLFNVGYDAANLKQFPGITVLKENSTPASANYIRMQAVNALPGTSNIHFYVDGQPLGSFLGFGAYTNYASFGIGPHKVQVLDAGNNELASRVFNTYSLDNLTLWAWKKNGVVQLLTTSNDFSMSAERAFLVSGFTPELPQTLGTGFGWQCRFFNLAEDVPYATFLDQTGTFVDGAFGTPVYNRAAAYKWLTPGTVPVTSPYVGYGLAEATGQQPNAYGINNGAVINVYSASDTTGMAGTLLYSLDHPMIANPSLYKSGAGLPAAEPGLYTMALIGNSKSTNAADKARLIVIKHNK